MSLTYRFRTLVFFIVLVHQAQCQTGSNVPNSPLWPIFSQLLSTQTGRSLQDINVLGVSDPTIKQLWTSYSAALAQMTPQTPAPAKTPATTTLPPLPDLYQTSYSFSSNMNQPIINSQAASTGSASTKTASADNSALYSNILNLINQLSSTSPAGNTAPKQTSTNAQDVMQAYAQLSASNSGSNPTQGLLNQVMASAGGSTTTGATDYQALLQKSLAGTSNNAMQQNQVSGTSGNSVQASTSGTPSYQSLVDQYNSLMSQGGSAPASTLTSATYEQLLQQYNQIMGGKTSGASTSSNSGTSGGTPSSTIEQYPAVTTKQGSGTGTPTDKLLQMYNLMMSGSNSSAAVANPPPQETFDAQLTAFFPQFKSLFPQSSTGNTSASSSTASTSTDPAASNTAQMIFDALLFGPQQKAGTGASPASATPVTPAPPTETSTQPPPPPPPAGQNSALSFIQNMVNSGAGSDAILSNHVQNVFKTRASRDMGCRFLPELLELEIIPTAPINCMNRCPFPYINSQQFGVYCVCCPPGVNEQAVGMMSLLRGTSYMETPLAVVS